MAVGCAMVQSHSRCGQLSQGFVRLVDQTQANRLINSTHSTLINFEENIQKLINLQKKEENLINLLEKKYFKSINFQVKPEKYHQFHAIKCVKTEQNLFNKSMI